MRLLWICFSVIVATIPAYLQEQVADPRQTYERVLCVVPMTGAGTWADPRRPMFAPARSANPTDRSGILAFTFVHSDDGLLAIVELVARDRAALKPVLESSRADVRAFEKGRRPAAAIEQEFRRYRRDFELKSFGVPLP
jgi:hypothetical protein